MELILQTLRWAHTILGFIGLFVFWIPVLSKKGGKWHRQFGQIFRWSAYGVFSSAGLSLLLNGIRLLQQGITPSQAINNWSFLLFLAYLTLITAIILSHGTAVLRYKSNIAALARPWRIAAAVIAIICSFFIIAWAWYWQPGNAMLLYALSPIGILNGLGMLRFYRQREVPARSWIPEHLGALLGCGIAYHTAFSAFGARQLFEYSVTGWGAVLPWILPTLLGIPAIVFWTRQYSSKPVPTKTQGV